MKRSCKIVTFPPFSKGPPGLTVRGPEGPPGPPGIPGHGSGGAGDYCGCNQTLLRQYIKEMKPVLIAGPPGNPGPPVKVKKLMKYA
jgi:hypothetical protein